MHVRRCSLPLTFALLLVPADHAFGQAWVGEKNSGWASLDYSFTTSNTLIEEDGVELDDEQVQTHTMTLRGGYSPIDRLGLELSASYLAAKYGGDGIQFPAHGDYDDGDFHGTFQDLAFRARYQVMEELFALAPHLGASIPLTDYEVYGWANAGRHLKALLAGVSAGKFLVRRLFLHGVYEIAFPERFDRVEGFEDYSQVRSDLALAVGYFVLDELEVHAAADFHWQHGGVSYFDLTNRNDPLFLQHDPVLQERFIQAGGGATWTLGENVRLTAEARFYVGGKNTLNRRSGTLGVAYDID